MSRCASNRIAFAWSSERWSSFWSSFVHIVRNAVDHGLEEQDERVESGKSPNGNIDLATFTEDREFVVQIADDGRGVDWDAVIERAKEVGLSHATTGDLTEALFADGFTTRRTATQLSGRGIGMGAARRACEAHGGVARVISKRGQGTTVQFRFPLEAMGAEGALG